MVKEPQLGDVLLRANSVGGFQIVDAVSGKVVIASLPTLEAAVEAARGRGAIWQQSVDNRGRPLGDPYRLLHPPKN